MAKINSRTFLVFALAFVMVSLLIPVGRADDTNNTQIVVGINDYDYVYWNLYSGDGIYGDFQVTNPSSGADQIITFFICDQSNFDKWTGGQDATVYHLQENVASYDFKFVIPHSDTWYFVFRNYALLLSKTINFNVNRDTTPPSITMNLDSGATYSGIKDITATITEATFEISYVKLYVDGVLKKTEYDDSFSYSWVTTDYSNGQHTVKIVASDNVGNEDYLQKIVNVYNAENEPTTDNADSSGTGVPMTSLIIGISFIIVIAAVAVVISKRRSTGFSDSELVVVGT